MVFAINCDIIMAFSSIEASSCHTEVEDRGNKGKGTGNDGNGEEEKSGCVAPFLFSHCSYYFFIIAQEFLSDDVIKI